MYLRAPRCHESAKIILEHIKKPFESLSRRNSIVLALVPFVSIIIVPPAFRRFQESFRQCNKQVHLECPKQVEHLGETNSCYQSEMRRCEMSRVGSCENLKGILSPNQSLPRLRLVISTFSTLRPICFSKISLPITH